MLCIFDQDYIIIRKVYNSKKSYTNSLHQLLKESLYSFFTDIIQ